MKIVAEIQKTDKIFLELDETVAPKTVNQLIKKLPFKVGLNIWGDEIYTDPTPIKMGKENAKSVVDLFDVAYWHPGNAICLFYGPTPLSTTQIKPYSPVNVIGKIKNPDKTILSRIVAGTKATFREA
ncbi:MAG: cyclophilin-like fold protein [Thermoproteota archaeon]